MSISSTKTKDLATATERDPRWAADDGPRQRSRRQLLLFSPDHRGLLPPVLRGPAPPPRERAVPFHPSGCRAGGVPPLQALQARPAVHRRAARGAGDRGLPPDRVLRGRAEPRGPRRRRRDEPLPFPPGVQGGHRAHATGLCRGAPGRAGPPRAQAGAHGLGRHLRIRLQLQRAVLSGIGSDARHDAERLPGRRRRSRDPVRRGPVLAGRDPGRPKRAGSLRHPAGRRSRRPGARAGGPLSRRRR